MRVSGEYAGFLPRIFSGGARSIVMQTSFVMLFFCCLILDQISGGGAKVSEEGPQTVSGGAPCGRKLVWADK